MRFLVYSVLPVVMAVDFTFFSDETCGTPTLEIKGKSGGGASTDPEVKITLSASTIATAAPGVCTTLSEEWTTKSDQTGAEEVKYAFARTTSCTEYGQLSMSLFTKGFKDCKPIKAADLAKADNKEAELVLTGYTSMCHQVAPNLSSTAERSVNSDLGGANGAVGGVSLYGTDKPIYYYKINCNPAPGDVWAIVLSSLAIVFAFAGIGLAVVAKGK